MTIEALYSLRLIPTGVQKSTDGIKSLTVDLVAEAIGESKRFRRHCGSLDEAIDAVGKLILTGSQTVQIEELLLSKNSVQITGREAPIAFYEQQLRELNLMIVK